MKSKVNNNKSSSAGVFSRKDVKNFFKSLRIHFIGFLVYPAVFTTNHRFPLKIGKVPPVIDPLVAGPILLDTEFKVSHFI